MAHLKALVAPKQWKIKRKENKWVARPKPGPHNKKAAPLIIVLKSMLGVVQNKKETRHILQNKEVLLNAKTVKDPDTPTGLMDVITLPALKKDYRVTLDEKGRWVLVEIPKKESNLKICRVTNKKTVKKGRIQITLHDGTTALIKQKISVGDSALIQLPENKVTQILKNKKGALVLVTGGTHVGEQATILDYHGYKGVQPDKIELKTSKGQFATLENYVLVVGDKKPEITIQ